MLRENKKNFLIALLILLNVAVLCGPFLRPKASKDDVLVRVHALQEYVREPSESRRQELLSLSQTGHLATLKPKPQKTFAADCDAYKRDAVHVSEYVELALDSYGYWYDGADSLDIEGALHTLNVVMLTIALNCS